VSYDYSALAARYAAYRPRYPMAVVEALAAACRATAAAWDVGCGSGQLTVGLAARFGRVVATDTSAAQLAAAEPRPNVEYRVARAEQSGLEAGAFDLVVAAQAAHWFDWPRFCAEASRVARAGSMMVAFGYGRVDADGPVGEVLRQYERDVAPWWPPERAHVENGYRDLVWPLAAADIAMPRQLVERWSCEETFGYATTWSATARYREANGDERLERMRAELRDAWGAAELREIRWPLAVQACRNVVG
jgi:SAM-dependent methyltransferase